MAERSGIFFVSSSYPENAKDWRGRFIADIAAALAKRPDIILSIWAPPGELPDRAIDALPERDRKWLKYLIVQGGIAHQLRRGGFGALSSVIGMLSRLHRAYRNTSFDIAHVNWLQNSLPLWGTDKPAVITVLGNDYGLLDKPGMRTALRAVFRQRHTVLAPNAAWMVPKLQSTFGDVARVEAIPFGVDNRWFDVDRRQAEADCWLAVTRLTKSKIGHLFDWGQGLFGHDRQLHLFGPMQEQVSLPSWAIWHGPTHPCELREVWFPRATGLITLSDHDEGRPQVMIEAMAAGIPVIASGLPAHRDLLRHMETGMLADSRVDLTHAITTLEESNFNRQTGEAARNWVKRNIGDWDDCAARYSAVYQELSAS